MANRGEKYVLWFKEVNNNDVGLVGGKNASLGEMYQELTGKGILIPNGFAITARAYRYFIESAGLATKIRAALAGLDKSNVDDLEAKGLRVRTMIMAANLPGELVDAVTAAYHELEEQYSPLVDVAVRSSATAEDLPNASFAGQQESYLNVTGVEALLYSTKRCIASLYQSRNFLSNGQGI